jgi:hypothetical protein
MNGPPLEAFKADFLPRSRSFSHIRILEILATGDLTVQERC